MSAVAHARLRWRGSSTGLSRRTITRVRAAAATTSPPWVRHRARHARRGAAAPPVLSASRQHWRWRCEAGAGVVSAAAGGERRRCRCTTMTWGGTAGTGRRIAEGLGTRRPRHNADAPVRSPQGDHTRTAGRQGNGPLLVPRSSHRRTCGAISAAAAGRAPQGASLRIRRRRSRRAP